MALCAIFSVNIFLHTIHILGSSMKPPVQVPQQILMGKEQTALHVLGKKCNHGGKEFVKVG